jgi:integrase
MPSGSIKQIADGRYSVRWRTPDGRQHRRTFTQRKAAERFLRRTLTDIEEHGITGTTRGETLGDALDEWWQGLAPTVADRTATRYRRHRVLLAERYGDVRLDHVDYARVQGIVNDLAASYAPRTVGAIYGVLALTLKHAALTGKIRPIPKPRMPKVSDPDPTIPSRDDVERLADTVDLRLRAMIVLAGYCGFRQGELLGIERQHVRLDEARIYVARAVDKETQQLKATKTKGSRRWVVLPRRALEVLEWHMAEIEPGERVFPYTASMVDKAWAQASGRSVRFHDLRHAAASMMIASGWNIMQVSRQLGHSKPSITLDVYGFLYPESFSDAVEKLDAYLAHDAT